MPYRSLLWTAVALTLSLVLLFLWLRGIAEIVHGSASGVILEASLTNAPSPERALRRLVTGTLVLSLLLIGLLLVVGVAASAREWMKRKPPQRRRVPYVDAWKLAGERLQEE